MCLLILRKIQHCSHSTTVKDMPNLTMKKQSHKQEYPIKQLTLALQDVSITKDKKRLKNFSEV